MEEQTPAQVGQPIANDPPRPQKEEVLFSWKVPARPFKRRDKNFFTTVAALAFLIGLIFFFLEGILAVAVVMSLVFLVYVLSTVPPEEVEHNVTNKGVSFSGKKYHWDNLRRFWFTRRFGHDLLVIESTVLPGRLEVVVWGHDKAKIQDALEEYIPFEEAAPSFLDRAAAWVSKKVPFEE